MIDAKKLMELSERATALVIDEICGRRGMDYRGEVDEDVQQEIADAIASHIESAFKPALLSSCERAERMEKALKPIKAAIRHDGKGIDLADERERSTWDDDAHIQITITAKEVWAVLDALSEHEASGKGGSDETR